MGLPLVIVLVTILYASGVIPQEKLLGLFGVNSVSPITTYLTEYDELMSMHNEVNQQLTSHLKLNDFSDSYKQELQTIQQNIEIKTTGIRDVYKRQPLKPNCIRRSHRIPCIILFH